MGAPCVPPAKELFSQNMRLSVSRLLSMLRKYFDMETAFIGKFEGGYRTAIYVENAQGGGVPEEGTFCHPENETYCRKIADGELPSIISDTSRNPTTRAMPVTEELSIGSYVGVPLYLSNGELYGTLCCMKKTSDSALEQRDPSLLQFVAEVIADKIEDLEESQERFRQVNQRIADVVQNQKMQMHFQPIWSLRREIIAGYEALARFNTDPYRTPDVWFKEAAEVGQQEYLESLAISMALDQLEEIPDNGFLSLNASPALVLSGRVADLIDPAVAHRIVLEVTEHSKILSYRKFRNSLESLRNLGVRLAIDDAGAGYASFHHVLELDPDVIKLDLKLIRDIHKDRKKQALALALISYARRVGATVVAEGVETEEEFSTLLSLDVDKVQGYLIGKPAPLPVLTEA